MRRHDGGSTRTSIPLLWLMWLCLPAVSGWYLASTSPSCHSKNLLLQARYSPLSRHRRHYQPRQQRLRASLQATTSTTTGLSVGPRIAIHEDFEGLQRIHSNPDIYIISNFLSKDTCRDLIHRAQQKKLDPSPVAYAGWTEDFKDLVELAAKGPVTWLAIFAAWLQTKDDATASNVDLVGHMVQNFGIFLLMAVAGIAAYTKSRADGLQQLRTSTSTTLDDLSDANSGTAVFVRRTADLFTSRSGSSSSGISRTSSSSGDDDENQHHKQLLTKQAALFEAPTVIRYEAGQVLAPHYDANRSAQVEDANRGGQTLATILVYLNDVQRGGLTRFGKLPAASSSSPSSFHGAANSNDNGVFETKLTIQPKMGDALLFFPADANGIFDERTEHEGCPAVDEKWIARIWRHANRVEPPFGLDEVNLSRV